MVKIKSALNRLIAKIPLLDCTEKIQLSMSLLCFAIIVSAIRGETKDSYICICAMTLSTVGDIFMNFYPIESRSHKLLYTGAVFFMLSHLVYAYAYYGLIKLNSYSYVNTGTILSIACVLLITFALIINLATSKNITVKPSMIIIFGVYIIFVSINFVTIYSYSWSAISFSFIGGLFFLLSDLIIGIENLFKINNTIFRKLVWIFYPIGQVLILSCR